MDEQMSVEFVNTYIAKLNDDVAEVKKENVMLKAKIAYYETLLGRAGIQLKEAQDMINDLKDKQEVVISQEIPKEEEIGPNGKVRRSRAKAAAQTR